MARLSGRHWTCHICGGYRPDAKISVQKNWTRLRGESTVKFQQNVRYCNDRPECFEAAKTKVFFGELVQDEVQ